MILRLESSASRWVFFVASVLLAAPLSYFSLRSAWAEHLAESGTREALERATQLEPGDARNWYLLGRDFQYNLEAPDNARAIAAYRQALSFDPTSPRRGMHSSRPSAAIPFPRRPPGATAITFFARASSRPHSRRFAAQLKKNRAAPRKQPRAAGAPIRTFK